MQAEMVYIAVEYDRVGGTSPPWPTWAPRVIGAYTDHPLTLEGIVAYVKRQVPDFEMTPLPEGTPEYTAEGVPAADDAFITQYRETYGKAIEIHLKWVDKDL